MRIQSDVICNLPVKILYIEDDSLYKEIDLKNKQKSEDIMYLPTRKLVFGLDFGVNLFLNNKSLLSDLQNYYYYGQIGPYKGIILVEL